MFLNDGRMLNSDGRSGSIPVLPNPLPDDFTMTGFQWTQEPDGNMVGGTRNAVFDGRYLWATAKNGQLPRIDPQNGDIQNFPIKIGSNQTLSTYNSYRTLYAGGYIWLLTLHNASIIKVDPQSMEMSLVSTADGINGNSNIGTMNAEGAIYDGENAWIVSGAKLIKFNLVNENFMGYDLPEAKIGIIHTGDSLFLFGYNGKTLIRVELSDMSISQINIPSDVLNSVGFTYTFYSGIYDGESIWLPMAEGEKILQYTPSTGEMKGHIYQGTNLGDIPSYSKIHATLSESCVFDGRYIWTAPVITNRILRVDTQTGAMKGYEFNGTNMGNLGATDYKFNGIAFDGINIWLIPHKSDRLVRLSQSGDFTYKTIKEEYLDEQGNKLKVDKSQYILSGKAYSSAAPNISGYKITGYKLDGGSLTSGSSLTLPAVDADHTVTFIYKKNDGNSGDEGNNSGDCCCAPNIILNNATVNIDTINVYYSCCNTNSECCK